MPIINVKLLEGRSDEQQGFSYRSHSCCRKTTGANKEAIHVVIEEMRKDHYAVGGVRKSDQ